MTDEELEKAVRKAKRDYMRQWRAKNPEKTKQSNRAYWVKKALKAENGQEGEKDAETTPTE